MVVVYFSKLMQYNAHKTGRAPVDPNVVCLCLHIKKGNKDHSPRCFLNISQEVFGKLVVFCATMALEFSFLSGCFFCYLCYIFFEGIVKEYVS